MRPLLPDCRPRGPWSRGVVLYLVATLLAAPASVRASGDTTCTFTGDLNGDGLLSSGDAQTAFYIALGMYTPNYREVCAADCNHDGVVSAGDAQQVFMAALGMANCDNGCGPDAFEPDDASGTAGPLAAGATESHSFCPEGDEDWFAFTLPAEASVRLETVSGGLEAALVLLYDDALVELAAGQPGGSGLEQVIETTLAPGNYFARAAAASVGVVANYDVTLNVTPSTETDCDDDLDNDDDSDTDCQDADCAEDPACALPVSEICNDEQDNDGDELVDCADPGCANAPNCLPESACRDGLDNDDDGLSDCNDSDCAEGLDCQPETACYDYRDNDRDGLTDCADSDCEEDPRCGPPEVICQDGRDNDSDGQTDCADSDCAAADNCPPERACQDGRDNEADGLTDCWDPDCAAADPCDDPCCELAGGTAWLRGTEQQCAAYGGTIVSDSACLPVCCRRDIPLTIYEWRLPGECTQFEGTPSEAENCREICCFVSGLYGFSEPESMHVSVMTPEECYGYDSYRQQPMHELTACLREAYCCDLMGVGHHWASGFECPEGSRAAPEACRNVGCDLGENLWAWLPAGDCAGTEGPPPEGDTFYDHPECFNPATGEFESACLAIVHGTCVEEFSVSWCAFADGSYILATSALCEGAGGQCLDIGTPEYLNIGAYYAAERVCCLTTENRYSAMSSSQCVGEFGRPVDAAHCRNPLVCCNWTDPTIPYTGPVWMQHVMCPAVDVLPDDACFPQSVCCYLQDGAVTLPATACQNLGGEVTSDAACEPVCCERFWDHRVTTGRPCTESGGTPSDFSNCADVCCYDGDPLAPGGYSLRPGADCLGAGHAVVDALLCTERCCLFTYPANQTYGVADRVPIGDCKDMGYVAATDQPCAEVCCEYGQEQPHWLATGHADCVDRLRGFPHENVECRGVCCALPEGGFSLMLASECAEWGGAEAPDEALCEPVCCQYPNDGDGPVFRTDLAGNCTAAQSGTVVAAEFCEEVCCTNLVDLDVWRPAGYCEALSYVIVPDAQCNLLCCQYGGAAARSEFLSREACERIDGEQVSDGACDADVVCCELLAGNYAFRTAADCEMYFGGPVADELCGVCCQLPWGYATNLPDEIACQAEAGLVCDDSLCARVCCELPDAAHDLRDRFACNDDGGIPVESARCRAVCCDLNGAYSTPSYDECVGAGGSIVADDSRCYEVCCAVAGGEFALTTRGWCETDHGVEQADRTLCDPVCCVVSEGGAYEAAQVEKGRCQALAGTIVPDGRCELICCGGAVQPQWVPAIACTLAGGEEAPSPSWCEAETVCCLDVGFQEFVWVPAADCQAPGGEVVADLYCDPVCCLDGAEVAFVTGDCAGEVRADLECESVCCELSESNHEYRARGNCLPPDASVVGVAPCETGPPVCCGLPNGRYEIRADDAACAADSGLVAEPDACDIICCLISSAEATVMTRGECADQSGEVWWQANCAPACCQDGTRYFHTSEAFCASVEYDVVEYGLCDTLPVCCNLGLDYQTLPSATACEQAAGEPEGMGHCEAVCCLVDGVFGESTWGTCVMVVGGEVYPAEQCATVCCQDGESYFHEIAAVCIQWAFPIVDESYCAK